MKENEQEIIKSLAEELSHYRLYEVDEIIKVISPYFKLLHKKILESSINIYEKEYSELIKEQNDNFGSKKYIEIGLKIAANKSKRTQLRIALNNQQREDSYAQLKIKMAIMHKERDFLVNFIKQHHDFQSDVLPILKEIQSS